MEKTMMLPAMYNVLSQEEMTYTEGGATMTQALLAALIRPMAGTRQARRSVITARRTPTPGWTPVWTPLWQAVRRA